MLYTITVDSTMGTQLLTIALDLLPAALITCANYASPFLLKQVRLCLLILDVIFWRNLCRGDRAAFVVPNSILT